MRITTMLFTAFVLLLVVTKAEAQNSIHPAEIQALQQQMVQKAIPQLSLSKALQMYAVDDYVATRIEKSVNPELDFFKDIQTTDNDLMPYTRTNMSYDESGMIEIMYYDYDLDGQAWLEDRRILFERDESGYVRTTEYYDRFEEEFVPTYRVSWNFYQQTPMPESIIRERWEDGDWQNYERETITIEDGLPEAVLIERWHDGDWLSYRRMNFTEEGGDVVQLVEIWDDQWVNWERTTFTDGSRYNLIDFMLLSEEYYLLGLDDDLFRIIDDFPFSSLTEEVWDEDDEMWVYMEQFIRHVDLDEEEADRAIYVKHWDDGDWQIQFRLLFSDNEMQSIDDILMQIQVETDEEIIWHTQMIEDYTYDANDLLAHVIRHMEMEESLVDIMRFDFTWEEDPAATDAESPDLPAAATLHAAYPNPFNPVTVVPYEISMDGHVAIRLYDITGRYVMTLHEGRQPAGQHQVVVRADGLASGVYIIRMEARNYTGVRKITVVK